MSKCAHVHSDVSGCISKERLQATSIKASQALGPSVGFIAVQTKIICGNKSPLM